MRQAQPVDGKPVHLTPGSKIYQLFDHQEVVVEGDRETFIIQIKKIAKGAVAPSRPETKPAR